MSNTIPFLGRRSELEKLRGRISRPGLTIVAGAPRIGKSRLVDEVVGRARAERSLLAGKVQITKEKNDPVLYALADLYHQWFADSTWRQQAGLLAKFEGQKGKIARVGEEFAKIIAEALKPTAIIGVPVETIRRAFSKLSELDGTLKDGGIKLDLLTEDKTGDIIGILHGLTDRPALLVLDALDQLPEAAISKVFSLLLACLHRDDWPPVHFLLTVRDNKPYHQAWIEADNLQKEFPSGAIIQVNKLEFRKDLEARDTVLGWVRETIPATHDMSDDRLIAKIDGQPGVLEEWQRQRPTDEATLDQVAHDAYRLHYDELKEIFESILQEGGDLTKLAARLALSPEIVSEDQWEAFRPVVMDSISEEALKTLARRMVLDPSRAYPSFGHTTRYETAHDWWLNTKKAHRDAKEAVEHLIFGHAARINRVAPDISHHVSALYSMEDSAAKANSKAHALCFCTIMILDEDFSISEDLSKLIQNLLASTKDDARVAACVSQILCYFFDYYLKANQPDKVETLLKYIRDLLREHPGDTTLQYSLAVGLVFTIKACSVANRMDEVNAFLVELRDIAAKHPVNAALRLPLAVGLVTTIHDYISAKRLNKVERFIQESHDFVLPDNYDFRKLAICLVDRINPCLTANELNKVEALFSELRDLVQDYPEEGAMRVPLSGALVSMIIPYSAANQPEKIEILLGELRDLVRDHPEDAAVRERLAKGLFNTIHAYSAANQLDNVEELLAELRDISLNYPQDAAVLEEFARGLVMTIISSSAAKRLDKVEALLEELRVLVREHSKDAAVREKLAFGFLQTIKAYSAANHLDRIEGLLGELRDLAQDHPEDAGVRETLAAGLFNCLIDASNNHQELIANALSDELGTLVNDHPNDERLNFIRKFFTEDPE